MSVRLSLPGLAEVRLIVNALHTADLDEERRRQCLHLAFEISAGLLGLQQHMELTRRINAGNGSGRRSDTADPSLNADQPPACE